MAPMRERRAWSAGLLACALAPASLLTGCRAERPGDAVDLILYDGTVMTLDPAHPDATAVAVSGGRIAAVGADDALLKLAGPRTRTIDLRKAFVLPGLTDSHGHVGSLGERLSSIDVRGVGSIAEIAARVREAAGRAHAPGDWLTGGGWDQNLWEGRQFPGHQPLDEASPDRPVYLRRVDGHAAWVNSAALRAAGITRATPDPPGGRIVRDPQGDPTGVFVDNAVELVRKVEPRPSRARIKSWITAALNRCAAGGLTEVHDASVSQEQVAAYRELADEGALPLRVYLMWDGTSPDSPVDAMLSEAPFVNYRDRVTLRAVKLMVDGAMGSRGAVFFDDYSDAKGTRGLFVTPPDEIARRATLALRRGYQVCTHAIGDRGIREVLDAYERALRQVPGSDRRLRIEHVQCVRQGDLADFGRLGLVASMQPSHATSDMPWAEERVGPDRGRGLYAWRWVIDAGIPIAGGSDFPVDPETPLVGIHSAVTRQDRDGHPAGGWHPGQRMTLDEALAAYTTGAAYAAFEEKDKGRIVPGAWADLTILSEDLRRIPAERIADVAVRATLVGGRFAYEAF
jgi:predicted amidohydrolase YtcJ